MKNEVEFKNRDWFIQLVELFGSLSALLFASLAELDAALDEFEASLA